MSEASIDVKDIDAGEDTHAGSATDKINTINGKVYGFVDRMLGVIGDRPWDRWLKKADETTRAFLPAVILIVGITGWLVCLFMLVKHDARISRFLSFLFALIPVLFSALLAPKALVLVRSLLDKSPTMTIRPELLSIMKVLIGLGGFIYGLCRLLEYDEFYGWTGASGFIWMFVALLMIIAFGCPKTIGIRAGYPQNTVEEIIALLMFPIRVAVVLMTMIATIGLTAASIKAITLCFGRHGDGMMTGITLIKSAIIPLAVPLATYVLYVVVVCILDLYKAVASVPRKLDELKDRK